MTNYEKTESLIKETKKLYFNFFMLLAKETDFSDLDDDMTLMLKNSMVLMDKGFDLALSLAKQNDEMSEKLDSIESKLDAALARKNQ